MSLLEVAEDVMRRQGIQKLPASEYTNPPPTGLQKTDFYVDSPTDQEQFRRFCVNMPCIPLNLEVPLPTLYVLTKSAFRIKRLTPFQGLRRFQMHFESRWQ